MPPKRKHNAETETAHELQPSLKRKLKQNAAIVLEEIKDPDQRALAKQAISTLAKEFLNTLDDLPLPAHARLDEDHDPNSEPEALPTGAEALAEQIRDVKRDLAQEEDDLKRFRGNRKAVELRERDEARDRLLPLVKALYPEMGKRVADLQSDAATSDLPSWLKDLVADKASELDGMHADPTQGMPEQVYVPTDDEWLQEILAKTGTVLSRLNKATACLDRLDDLLQVALNASIDE